MKNIRSNFYPMMILVALVAMQACKPKKIVQQPAPVATTAPAPVEQPKPVVAETKPTPPAPVEKPDFNFSNVQFEYDSGILKTEAYAILDKAASEMKKDPTAKFDIKGYASAEGDDAHNMKLSVDRANAVKVYLFNSGISANNLVATGYGEANPVADNTTDAGRIINRRVEIKVKN